MERERWEMSEGLSLRDRFAMQAMVVLLEQRQDTRFIASAAYKLADSMMIERDKA